MTTTLPSFPPPPPLTHHNPRTHPPTHPSTKNSVSDEIYKLASINLSPNVPGQFVLGLMINGPRPGDESYAQYAREKQELLDSLRCVRAC
jgi:hypothetical protein